MMDSKGYSKASRLEKLVLPNSVKALNGLFKCTKTLGIATRQYLPSHSHTNMHWILMLMIPIQVLKIMMLLC